MADNTVLSTNVGTGDTIRTLEDGSSIKWPAGVTAFATTVGSPDVLSIVTPTAGLPVRLADGSGYLTALPITDNSGSLTVDGTVAATQSGTWTVTGTGGTFPVTDSGGSLTVDNGGTFAVQVDGAALTALQLIDNIVLAEDAVHASGDPGVMALAVRRDTAASSTLTDGDYATLNVDSTGRLWCNVSNTVTVAAHDVTNAGTFAVQAAQSGTWNITNISGTVSLPTGAATAANQSTANTSLSSIDGKITACNTGAVTISAALPAGTNNIGDVDVLSLVPGTGATNLGKAEDAAHTTGDTGVAVLAVRRDAIAVGSGTDGDYSTLNVDANGALYVTVNGTVTVASHAVTNAGTFAVQVDGAALTSLQLIDDAVSGAGFNISQMNGVNVSMGNGASGTGVQRVTLANDSTGVLATVSTVTTLTGSGVAHDAIDSGNPHKIGAKAETALSGITLVADGDRTDLHAGVDGVLITRPHCNLEDIVSGNVGITDGSSTSVIAAQGAGIKVYITSVIIANSSASNVTVDIRDGAAGAVKATFPAPTVGGCVHPLPVPLAFSANTAVCADPSAAASTVTVTLVGFKSKV